jgi:two-component system, chemotaxis family, protein-glutamate methylesterase/glutaminase
MDMMMPRMTGLQATEHIMGFCPTRILVVSASFNRGEVFRTFDALRAGALEVIDKPRGDEVDQAWEERLRRTVRLVARIPVISHVKAKLGLHPTPAARAALASAPSLVAIGASTGGPAAVSRILKELPREFPLPVLLVVHISEAFALPFAQWLSVESALPVRLAREGEPLPALGTPGVWIAPPDRHLELHAGHLRLSGAPERHACRPSIDVLFESLVQEAPRVAALLLTGMGRDGAQGLLALRRAGAVTVAQDEASSVVFGMPREAIALGAASRVLPVGQMAPFLGELVDGTASGSRLQEVP